MGTLPPAASHSSVTRRQLAGPVTRLASSDWRRNGAFWVRTSVMAKSNVRSASWRSTKEASA